MLCTVSLLIILILQVSDRYKYDSDDVEAVARHNMLYHLYQLVEVPLLFLIL